MPDLTSQEMADAVTAIQNKIGEIIQAELPDTKVWTRWIENRDDRDDWGRHLNNANGIIDAVTIEFAGLGHPDITQIPGGTIEPQPTFVIDVFEQFGLGDESDNSSKRARDKVIRIMFALSVKTDLDVRHFCKGHTHLQAPPQAEVVQFGDRFSHWIPCSLTVLMANFYTR